MKYDNEMTLQIASKSQNEAFARVAVAAFVSQLNPTVSEIADIKTAVSEAVTNAIIHGYDQKEDIVEVFCGYCGDIVYIEVRDNGRGIEDIMQARQPLYTSKPEMERSGMGFTVMETFMDELNVESQLGIGTKVRMTKKIKCDSDL
ncbi:MAG: anti-sigma F factor [Epulopiscium sp.]|jgi:stage II sporulation protein AB (anti-sigma F factor)|nr:anti-sigma F factor [Candidatus Epulonipiscium sp.]